MIRTLALALLLPVSAHASGAAPTFADPVRLVTWLVEQSGHGFDPLDDATSANVFSPGLRAALRGSMLRSRQRDEPPCGADGDIILDTQEGGAAEKLRLSARLTAPDRTTVSAAYDVDGYHRNRRFMVVKLEGAWKLENIVDADGASLRRSLDCRQ